MPVEINGRLNPHGGSGLCLDSALEFDITYIQNQIGLFAEGGFDRVVIGDDPSGPDNITLAGYVGALTDRLGVVLEHRSGMVVPTMAARTFATLDHLLSGKLALHILDTEAKTGSNFASGARQAGRRAEFIEILRNIWSTDHPIDFNGEYYRFIGGFSDVKPIQGGDIPIFFAGRRAADLDVAARFANAVMIPFADVTAVGEAAQKVRSAGAFSRRSLCCAMSLHLVVEDGAAEAEARADTYRAQGAAPSIIGDSRQVIDKIMEYYAAGVSIFTLGGYDPAKDIARVGRDIVPALRARAAQYDLERGLIDAM